MTVVFDCQAAGGVSSCTTGRTISKLEVTQPVKQLAIAVGRLVDGGQRTESGVVVDVFTVPRLRSESAATLLLGTRIALMDRGQIAVLLTPAQFMRSDHPLATAYRNAFTADLSSLQKAS